MKFSTSIILITFSFFFLFIFENGFSVTTRKHLCHPQQKDALLQFKNELKIGNCISNLYGIDAHPKTESWTNNGDCCNWEGITCDAELGEVIELNLTSSCLYGQFHFKSSSFRLENLQFLTTLDLSNNHLTGFFPSSIGNFSHLINLDLSSNQFSGPISSSIGNLSHLTYLSLSSNQFSGLVPYWIENLSHLTFLDLSYNQFSGPIPSSIGNLSHLTYLALSSNQLSGPIPSSIGNLSHLTYLALSSNQFTGLVSSWIGNCSHLTFLDLSFNQFSGPIPSSIGNLSHLIHLHLSYNQFSGSIPSSIGNFSYGQFHFKSSSFRLESLQFLTTLDLSNNHLTGFFPSSIGNFSHLINLDLSSNQFSGPIPSSIGNLSHLTYLSLSSNQFSGLVSSWIGKLSHLTYLSLSSNQFSGLVSSWIGKLSHLTYLSLSSNQFSGPIPSSIGNLSHLTHLSLSSNKFLGLVPSGIGNLSHLTNFDISFNQFSSPIPSSIGNLSHLDELEISFNQFSGGVPSWIGNLSHLTLLYLSYNRFSGHVPGWLWTLPNLEELDLSNNTFIGFERPPKHGQSSILTQSRMVQFFGSNNKFEGHVPGWLWTLPNLGYLDFSNNNFIGFERPSRHGHSSIWTQSRMEQFLGSNNKFEGHVPGWLWMLPNLKALELYNNTFIGFERPPKHGQSSILTQSRMVQFFGSNNKFEGHVPGWLWTLPNLEALELYNNTFIGFERPPKHGQSSILTQSRTVQFSGSNNKFEGHVPGWLWTLANLGYLDFSNNNFIGFERPPRHGHSSIWTQSRMEQFFGFNNNFTGKIPSFICGLSSLSTLDLSGNNFNGSIPSCIGNLNSTLLDVNLRRNRLSGGLPEDIFENLRSLDVGHNQLVGKLPRSLIHFSSLEVLNVESNKISDTFPLWLSSLKKLKVLVLRSNFFHGPIHQALLFHELQIIDISHNHFNGTLSADYFVKWNAMSSIGENANLANGSKYMGSDYYQDSMVLMNKGVEMNFMRIPKIYTAIDFSGNKLEGEIPMSIGVLKGLHILNLSNNAFSGHIPSSMGNLTSLESLDVSQNKLSGEIPQELGNLTYLEVMKFSHNQLSGLVPGSTQFKTQPCSSFEDNKGLFGPSLDEACRNIHKPESKKTVESEDDEEVEVVSWIAALLGLGPGLVFGLTIGYILDFSLKCEFFIKRFR